MPPRVTVLMPVYNGSKYLQESIDSIQNQTYSDFEFIIIDDASTDNTWEILEFNAQKDKRIRLLRNLQNLGLIKTLNKGIYAALGQYIARQDADDISLPNRLESQVKALEGSSGFAMVSSNIQVITDTNKKPVEIMLRSCEPALVSWHLIFHNHIGGHSQVMYRKNTILALNGYSEAYTYIEDYELWCRLSMAGQKIMILPQILLSYRRHSQSVSAMQSGEQELRLYKKAQDNINNLINENMTIEDIKYLVGFWKGKRNTIWEPWHHRFPPSEKAGFIHQAMLKISDEFVSKNEELYPNLNLKTAIDKTIGRQFLYWLQSPLTSTHSIASKLEITRYAVLWNFSGVLLSWVTWFFRYPIDLTISLINRLSKKPAGLNP